MNRVAWTVLGLGMLLVGCDREKPAAPPLPASEDIVPMASLNRGAQLFLENCAQCHGPEGQGHPDWQTPGVIAAPPLNGTGNDIKRTRAQLVATIKNGIARDGVPTMPAWKDRLTEAEINEVIAWCQIVLWPPEIYSQWRRTTSATNPPG